MTPVASSLPELLQAALRYAEAGFRVFPVHVSTGTRCSCQRPKCDSPGKHPRTKNGLKDATTDQTQIREWWTKMPDSNIGIRTGSGLVVVDIDPRHGGDESLSALQEVNELLPPTVEGVTGGGGRHLLFHYDGELRNSVGIVGPGVDIRAENGFIVAPPSVHATGRSYEWASGRSPSDLQPAPLPGWLLTLATRRPAPVHTGATTTVIEGGRNEYLFSQACSMRGKSYPEAAILSALLALNASACRPPLDEVEVRQIYEKVVRNYAPGVYNGQVLPDGRPDRTGRLLPGGVPAAPPQEGNWEQELTFDKYSNVKGTVAGNAALLLANLPEWQGCLQFDAFNNRIDWTRPPPPVAGLGVPSGEFADHHVLYVQQWLARHRGVEFAKGHTQDAIISAARKNWVHPLQDYLNSLVWDGVPRLSSWLTTYLGSDRNDYTKSVGEWWAISAVARAMQPGCQVDHMLILEGKQGAGKSTAARILAGNWFLGSLPDLRGNSKEAADALNGHWIIEMGELDAMRGATLTKTKDFLSQPADTYRAAYARFKETHKRSCVFIGTTNESNYLRDASGARRFWPVKVTRLNRNALMKDKDQLWAEAKYMYDHGATWHPEDSHVEMLQSQQDRRFDIDPWEEIITIALDDFEQSELRKAKELKDSFKPTPLTTAYILERCLEIKSAVLERTHSNRLATIMHRIGWELRPKRFISPSVSSDKRTVVMTVWVRVDPTKDKLQPLVEEDQVDTLSKSSL